MIIHDMPQGSEAWFAARLGIPTASEFAKIITPAKGDLSKSARKYACRLVSEILLGKTLEIPLDNLEWVARGKLLEPRAVAMYEFMHDAETTAVGFVTTDCGRIGASPDRLIGRVGGLEIKCVMPQNHVAYFIDGCGDDYRPQVQGQLLVAELDYVDLFAYHPDFPPVLIKTYRDEPYIAKMRAALDEFLDMRDALLDRAKRAGFLPAPAMEAA